MNDYNLKQEIKKLGMTQKGFAEEFGLGENTVSQWVRGVSPMPKWAIRLIELLKIEQDFNTAKTIFCNK